ncbi:MAG: cytosolic protein, partial [Armatimonadota bacterium]|nr:cytosolic protein [Armatimonadota bacterium]
MEEATPYDAGWKLIFKVFLPDLVRMLFPAVWALVDWGAPVQERSAELLRLAPEAQTGRRYIDHLVEVQFKNGQRGELFLHFEAQSQPDPEFPKRMFIYHYRIRDYHATENLVSMAILADPDPNWRPSEYYTNLAGCELRFRFLTAKLLDLEEETLERELSPVALALLAHRKALRARGSPELTMQEKIALVRAMKARGYTHDEIIALYKVVDYFMVLPQEYEQLVQRVIHEVESEREFPLTSLERFAIMQGLQQGLEQGLQQGLEQGLQQGLQQG